MNRFRYLRAIQAQFRVHSVCAILGPRQVGKTTLARAFIEQEGVKAHFFDLEDPVDLVRLENPMTTFSNLPHQLIVIDEIQRRPDLFPVCGLELLATDDFKHIMQSVLKK